MGGYDRRTLFSSLGYMSEHLIAVAAAAGLGALLIYTAAAYDQMVHPSRGVLLASLAAFAPLSLTYRRFIGSYLLARTAQSFFLVIGTGERARRFYQSYLSSPSRQKLRFVATGSEMPPELPRSTGSRPSMLPSSNPGHWNNSRPSPWRARG